MDFLNTSFVWFFVFCSYWTVAFFSWVIKFFISRKSVLGNACFQIFSLVSPFVVYVSVDFVHEKNQTSPIWSRKIQNRLHFSFSKIVSFKVLQMVVSATHPDYSSNEQCFILISLTSYHSYQWKTCSKAPQLHLKHWLILNSEAFCSVSIYMCVLQLNLLLFHPSIKSHERVQQKQETGLWGW